MYLTRLAADETVVDDEYSSFLTSYIRNTNNLVEVIKALKCKLHTNNLEDYFEPLRYYIELFKPKQSLILKTSHVFCDCCELYIPSFLCVWVRNNTELFDTEVMFYYRFLRYFKELIKLDVTTYPVDELYLGEDTPLSGQTNREKLKLLASIIKHYDYICKYLLD
jgi:hypothetical protein